MNPNEIETFLKCMTCDKIFAIEKLDQLNFTENVLNFNSFWNCRLKCEVVGNISVKTDGTPSPSKKIPSRFHFYSIEIFRNSVVARGWHRGSSKKEKIPKEYIKYFKISTKIYRILTLSFENYVLWVL